MDFDEFQESDLMFSDYSSDQSVDSNDDENSGRSRISTKNRKIIPKAQRRILISSAPINIPTRNNTSFGHDVDDVGCSELFDEDYSDDNQGQWTRLPPHLIVERRGSGEMARSFSPLKGRNLCQVRNSILRKTGFLER